MFISNETWPSMEDTSNLVYYPDDVIIEILLRLQVKTLSQLKCVCKHWKALIESPDFINRHFLHENNHEYLFLRHYRSDKNKYAYALYLDETLSRYEEPKHLQMPSTVTTLMGPLNGIFCVVSVSKNMGLLNPAMRWFKPLHLVRPVYPKYLTACDDLLGFGFDPVSKSYKVVSIQYFWNEATDSLHHPSLVSVYNSGTDSWRHFEDVDLSVGNTEFFISSRGAHRSLCNTYMNGAYYWYMESDDSDGGLLVFDMTTELFREIKAPDGIKSKELDIAMYGESIALLACELDTIERHVDVWVMETEGCWNKILTVGPLVDIKWPLCFWKRNELLLETETSQLALYDVYARKLRTAEARRKENGFFIYWVFSYKESLVSLDGEKNKFQHWDPSSDRVKDFL